MFGLSQKERAAEALRRGALAAMSGGYFHHSHAAKLGLNEEAASYLYTDAIVHQLHALGFIASKALTGKSWVTSQFFFDAIVRGIREAEKQAGLPADTMVVMALKRFSEFEAMPPEIAANGGKYIDTAKKVLQRDATADERAICAVLEEATKAYFNDAVRMFS